MTSKVRHILFFLVGVMVLVHCGGVEDTRTDRYNRDRDRGGDLSKLDNDELDEHIKDTEDSIAEKFKKIMENIENCKPSAPAVAETRGDLIFSVFGLDEYNKPQQLRRCFTERLEKATEALCTAKQNIYTEKARYRNEDIRSERIESSIRRLERLQKDYQKTLRTTASKISCGSGNSLGADECEAWENNLRDEVFIVCDYDDRSSSRRSR